MAHERFQGGLAPEDLKVEDTVGATASPPTPPSPPPQPSTAPPSGEECNASPVPSSTGNPAAEKNDTAAAASPAESISEDGLSAVDSRPEGAAATPAVTSQAAAAAAASAATGATGDGAPPSEEDGVVAEEEQGEFARGEGLTKEQPGSGADTATVSSPDREGQEEREPAQAPLSESAVECSESSAAATAAAAAAAGNGGLVRAREEDPEAATTPAKGGQNGDEATEEVDEGVRTRRKKRAIGETGTVTGGGASRSASSDEG